MRIDVITLFPEIIESFIQFGVLGRAVRNELLEVHTFNPRNYTEDERRNVDDYPYGGNAGMVMKVDPLRKALQKAKSRHQGRFLTVYLSPQGRRLNQAAINAFAELDGMVLVAGRYEGVDERLIDLEIDEEWSLGDYVVSGGEPAAMVVIDAVARQCRGVLGDEDSARQDSFMSGLLDCPHYTRPAVYEGRAVPGVLLEGNHEAIRRWRLKQALGRTWRRRRDLIEARRLSDEELSLLNEYTQEHHDAESCQPQQSEKNNDRPDKAN